jgi:hypothetical protein
MRLSQQGRYKWVLFKHCFLYPQYSVRSKLLIRPDARRNENDIKGGPREYGRHRSIIPPAFRAVGFSGFFLGTNPGG